MNIGIRRSFLGLSRKGDLTLYRSGRMDISARIAAWLDLRSGDVVDIAQCEDGEYYLYVRGKGTGLTGRHRARCFAANRRRSRAFRVYCTSLTGPLLDMLGTDKAQIIAGDFAEFDNIGRAVTIIPHNILKNGNGT